MFSLAALLLYLCPTTGASYVDSVHNDKPKSLHTANGGDCYYDYYLKHPFDLQLRRLGSLLAEAPIAWTLLSRVTLSGFG